MPPGWSIPVPSLNWIQLTVPELGLLQFSIHRQLKSQLLRFLESKEGQISNFQPQKVLSWPERHIITYCAWGCVQKCDLWA